MSNSSLPDTAKTVIIGAGIVGNSLAYHLADQGREDIVLVDKGPFPDPGGSTGHASNFVFPVEQNKEMALMTLDSMEQYKAEGLYTTSGGIEVARTEERLDEFRRQIGAAKTWGYDAELISPAEVKEKVPYINEEIITGGFWEPNAGVVDPLRFGEKKRKEAEASGALRSFSNTAVLDIHTEDGAVEAIETDRGTIECEELVIATGLWAPKLARMAGTKIPLTPAVHQLISAGPIDELEETGEEVGYPIVRDVDTQMYERPSGNDMEVGSYEHRPILWDAEDIPSNEEAALSPTQPPLTEDAFDPSMEHALDLMPEILGDAEIRHAIDGLLSVTPDGMPVIGPMKDVDGLWSCAAIWIKEGPAFAKYTAQWMTQGYPEIDLHQSDVNRFEGYGDSKTYIKNRAHEGFQKIYSIVHPHEQWQSSRPLRQSGFYDRQAKLDANFFESAGWERPQWYESNQDLIDRYDDEIEPLRRSNEWDSRWWSETILAEHLHMRENLGMIGDMGFGIFDLIGDDVEEFTQEIAVGRTNLDVGGSVYTPILGKNGGFRSDLTIVRPADDHYRVITGGGEAGPDQRWFENHIGDRDVHIIDKSPALATLGVWGPHARDLLDEIADEDMSNDAFPPYTAQEITIGEVDIWAFRVSYVGELGWELYAPMEQAGRLWDIVYEEGQEYDIRPVGMGVYGTTGRMEKGYRLYGYELELDYTPAEAGLTFHGVKDADFIGKEAYKEGIETENIATLCTLSVDDHTSSDGTRRFPLGGEPILSPEGDLLVDEEGRPSYVTSAGSSPSLGKHLLMSYIPAAYAEEGQSLQIEYMDETYPVTVDRVGSKPLFDPENERIFQ